MTTVPILTYHALGDNRSPLFTSPARFESHLASLAQSGYRTITLRELAGHLRVGTLPPGKRCVLTFDDGYLSVYRDAWPILDAYGFKATIFLVTAFCGRDNQWPGQHPAVPRRRLMDWDQVLALAAEGNELGVHSCTHPPLPLLSTAQVEEEILLSQAELQTHTGQPAPIFAAPYGAVDERVEALIRRHFEAAVTTRMGTVSARDDPYDLPRIDAHYWQEEWAEKIDTGTLQRRLRLRQLLRALRRRFRKEWDRSADLQGNRDGDGSSEVRRV